MNLGCNSSAPQLCFSEDLPPTREGAGREGLTHQPVLLGRRGQANKWPLVQTQRREQPSSGRRWLSAARQRVCCIFSFWAQHARNASAVFAGGTRFQLQPPALSRDAVSTAARSPVCPGRAAVLAAAAQQLGWVPARTEPWAFTTVRKRQPLLTLQERPGPQESCGDLRRAGVRQGVGQVNREGGGGDGTTAALQAR